MELQSQHSSKDKVEHNRITLHFLVEQTLIYVYLHVYKKEVV